MWKFLFVMVVIFGLVFCGVELIWVFEEVVVVVCYEYFGLILVMFFMVFLICSGVGVYVGLFINGL